MAAVINPHGRLESGHGAVFKLLEDKKPVSLPSGPLTGKFEIPAVLTLPSGTQNFLPEQRNIAPSAPSGIPVGIVTAQPVGSGSPAGAVVSVPAR